jgi:hypothetical protein
MRSPSFRPRPHQPQGQPARQPRAARVSAMPSCRLGGLGALLFGWRGESLVGPACCTGIMCLLPLSADTAASAAHHSVAPCSRRRLAGSGAAKRRHLRHELRHRQRAGSRGAAPAGPATGRLQAAGGACAGAGDLLQ